MPWHKLKQTSLTTVDLSVDGIHYWIERTVPARESSKALSVLAGEILTVKHALETLELHHLLHHDNCLVAGAREE